MPFMHDYHTTSAKTVTLRSCTISPDYSDHGKTFWAACQPQTRSDFLNDSTYLSKWAQDSTAQECHLSSENITDDQFLNDDSYFDSTLEDLPAGNEPTWYSNISPDAAESRGEPTSLKCTPEKRRADPLEFNSNCISQQPFSDSSLGSYPKDDIDFGINGYISSSFPDKLNNTAPYANNASYLQHSNSSWVNCSLPLFPQALPSFSSSLLSRPSEPSTSFAPLTLSHPPNELHSSVSTSSQILLPRLSHLKCPHCPRLLSDKSQLW